MRQRHRSARVRLFTAGLLAAALSAAGPAAGSAAASDATACGLITQHDLAKAFGLKEATVEDTALREPGNPAGVVRVRCRASAWKGKQPMGRAGQRRALLAGTFARIRVETWVTDPGPYEGAWLASFPRKLEGLQARAKAQFVEGSRSGSTFAPPLYGAEAALAYRADTAKTTRLRAFWWRARSGELISFTLEAAKGLPVLSALRTLAARMVPGIAT